MGFSRPYLRRLSRRVQCGRGLGFLTGSEFTYNAAVAAVGAGLADGVLRLSVLALVGGASGRVRCPRDPRDDRQRISAVLVRAHVAVNGAACSCGNRKKVFGNGTTQVQKSSAETL